MYSYIICRCVFTFFQERIKILEGKKGKEHYLCLQIADKGTQLSLAASL